MYKFKIEEKRIKYLYEMKVSIKLCVQFHILRAREINNNHLMKYEWRSRIQITYKGGKAGSNRGR